MKKIFDKKTVIMVIIWGMIFTSIGICAANYSASDISYTKEGWEVSNVGEAISSLYNIKSELEDIKSLGTADPSHIKAGETVVVNGQLITGTALTAVYCGAYSSNGSFDITKYGLSNVDVNKFVFVPKMSQIYSYASPAHVGSGYGYDNYLYVRGYGSYVPHTFTLNGNNLSFTLPAANGSAYNGPTLDNATAKVGGSWNVPVTGAIYYIG